MKRITPILILALALLLPQPVMAWNSTGHRLVARIAWDNMTPTARQNVVNLLMQAPQNACLREQLSNDSRPLEVRQREFFTLAATWPDIIRPRGQNDTRPCTQFHRKLWHFVDHFWSGTSGDPNDPPHNLTIPIAQVNAVERLVAFRPIVAGNLPAGERAMDVAWILHLVGDIHQPLHTSGRVTTRPQERLGDGGGNAFKLRPVDNSPDNLHSYWDDIVDIADPQHPDEGLTVYIDRVATEFENAFPRSRFNQTLQPGDFNQWALESLKKAQDKAYPRTLRRKRRPSQAYQASTFGVAQESIAEGGYRLADLLNTLFGS
jgi:hypothetical protein